MSENRTNAAQHTTYPKKLHKTTTRHHKQQTTRNAMQNTEKKTLAETEQQNKKTPIWNTKMLADRPFEMDVDMSFLQAPKQGQNTPSVRDYATVFGTPANSAE